MKKKSSSKSLDSVLGAYEKGRKIKGDKRRRKTSLKRDERVPDDEHRIVFSFILKLS